MNAEMTKDRFLRLLLDERARWDELLSQVDEAHMTTPGVEGEWSLKDIIAHVAWYEGQMVGVLRQRSLVGSDLWELPTDERNAAIHEQNRHRALADVLAEARQVYAEFVDGVRALTTEDLHDPGRFAGMPADWIPWQVIASNSFEHYPQHIPAIRDWLEKT